MSDEDSRRESTLSPAKSQVIDTVIMVPAFPLQNSTSPQVSRPRCAAAERRRSRRTPDSRLWPPQQVFHMKRDPPPPASRIRGTAEWVFPRRPWSGAEAEIHSPVPRPRQENPRNHYCQMFARPFSPSKPHRRSPCPCHRPRIPHRLPSGIARPSSHLLRSTNAPPPKQLFVFRSCQIQLHIMPPARKICTVTGDTSIPNRRSCPGADAARSTVYPPKDSLTGVPAKHASTEPRPRI